MRERGLVASCGSVGKGRLDKRRTSNEKGKDEYIRLMNGTADAL